MSKKFVCPECKEKEVEEINACGASNYFCNSCKRLISRSKIREQEQEKKMEEKA